MRKDFLLFLLLLLCFLFPVLQRLALLLSPCFVDFLFPC